MRNITLAVSDEAHRRVRIWAAQHDTSISAFMSYCLEHLPILPIVKSADAHFKAKKEEAARAKDSSTKP
jgi:hypothetical protein